MTSARCLSAVLLASVFLAGCGPSGEEELRTWMQELRASIRPRVVPITEPKQFIPQNYVGESGMDPFNVAKLTQALRRDSAQVSAVSSLVSPEMARRKQPLEAYPLDAMTMVGSLNKAGMPTALLRVEKLLYQVRVGDYVGQNHGKIVKITETGIQIREIVQDVSGDWVERMTSLDLQEGKR